MKLQDICEMKGSVEEHIMDFLEDFLRTHNFKLKVARAIEGLEDDQMEKLKGMLFAEAEDNYDYATDTGPSVFVKEESVIKALQKMGVL